MIHNNEQEVWIAYVPEPLVVTSYEAMIECYEERNLRIVEMRKAGFSIGSLCEIFKISRARVHKIINKMIDQ